MMEKIRLVREQKLGRRASGVFRQNALLFPRWLCMNASQENTQNENPVAAASTELLVTGMTCNNCARHVTEAIQSVPGVRSASVQLEASRASVRWADDANVPAVISAVKAAGYEAKPVDIETHDYGEQRQSGWHLNLWIGVGGTLPLMLGEWVFDLGMTSWFQWFAFALASVVQVFAGAQFYREI